MKQAARDLSGAQRNFSGLYLVPASKDQQRASMVAKLRQQVRAGTYSPNLRVVAERMLVTHS